MIRFVMTIEGDEGSERDSVGSGALDDSKQWDGDGGVILYVAEESTQSSNLVRNVLFVDYSCSEGCTATFHCNLSVKDRCRSDFRYAQL
ncbi:hypothetical protein BLNAU_22069 [Blattamonas nauphoetae]|uniref:Uncharacterized protein n=1 Tax=Blattamonas nauphoetae TaxID=2049346 RepID=A0ABQ9WUK9_9EUKA|nr:hypothetical protein BLNAU_22069 [Blattamonas nauphoetae]